MRVKRRSERSMRFNVNSQDSLIVMQYKEKSVNV